MKRLAVAAVVGLLVIIFFVWINNKWITVSEYIISSPDIPAAFSGARIVQISDLHNATFGSDQAALLEKVAAAEPDVIFVTGDLVDNDRYDPDVAIEVINGLSTLAEVYFVTGNHEISRGRVNEILSALEETGITILENEMVEWMRKGERIYIAGVHDPLLGYAAGNFEYSTQSLEAIPFTAEFTLLLAHRPELVDEYMETEADVVFSGHAHGGQIRLPGLGGLYAPGQGFFPELTEGVTRFNDLQLVISRGLGNSSFPLRIFNRPEIVVVTLDRE
ncbi:metallophosphoesterase [Planococcus lenghuensis]|uniref:Phosphoesterase n=1 Tax=Planococcus lenghuensis TaxID=2213202 RepID=A0A1Q2L1W6_9BACL|nr:metallophosphoesterase [Planococcus lenghuensis]AQQ54448.1 phosphoesterase [Planococcus lenghuensis]